MKTVLRWLFILVVWLVLIEGAAWLALRVRPDWRHTPVTWSQAECFRDADWVDDYFAEWWQLQLRWEPYVYWRSRTFHGRYINVGENGLRNTWNPEGRDGRNAVRIYMFGGSTLWGLGARDHHTIPSLVSQWLAKNVDTPVEVVNCGELGFVNTQELLWLIKELQKQAVPDLAVFYDGVNDVFSAYQAGRPGLPQNEHRREKEFNLLGTQGGRTAFLAAAAAYQVVRMSATVRLASHFIGSKSPGLEKQLDPEAADRLATGAYTAYLQNVAMIQALADRMGFAALFYWQPTIFTKPQRTPHENRQHDQQAPLRCITLAANRRVAQCSRLSSCGNFHDLADIYADHAEGLFFDYCHTGEAGNQIVAEKIAQDIQEVLRRRAQ